MAKILESEPAPRCVVLSACRSSISKTIIHVCNGFAAHPNRDSFPERRTFANFVNWMLFSGVSNLRRNSRNVFPDAGSSFLGICAKRKCFLWKVKSGTEGWCKRSVRFAPLGHRLYLEKFIYVLAQPVGMDRLRGLVGSGGRLA